MDESSKLFRLPGTIEEEEEEEQQKRTEGRKAKELIDNATESLLSQKGGSTFSTLPRNVTLLRVNTQSSSIAGGIGRQDSTRSRYRPGPTRKLRRRAVLKNGDCNVLQSRISQRRLRFLQDIFTTLVDTQWRWTLLCFILSFILSWLGFAVIWWLIAFTHGDFEEHHLPPYQTESNWTPCVLNIFSFTSCFLFSIETQHTIGYGSRSTTEECPEAIFIMCLQSISGVMIQAFMVGIVFAKMSRPKQRTQTLLFSRNAVICQRDGELCLMFRVGDMRKSHIIGASVRAQMIRTKTTLEGEILSQHQYELVVGTDGENGDLFFIWPTTIIHRIKESSPFYNISAEDMLTERFEVVLILEGTIESTGQTTQARTSYLPQEILWGHRFDSMVSYSKERQGYEVDYSLFNSTTQVDTPLCSGRELAEFYKAQEELRHGTDVLIDKNRLMRRECAHSCHPINHQSLQMLLTPVDCAKSHISTEDECYWQNNCKCPNCIFYEPQVRSADQSKDFDFNAIQVMENEELQQLPEAVNMEIVKNSEEIVFEEEDEVSERNVIKLNGMKNKVLNCNQEIFFEVKERNILQRTTGKNAINKENKTINQKSLEGEEKDTSAQALISPNKDTILKNKQSLFKAEKRNMSEQYIIRLKKEMTDKVKNTELTKKNCEMCLKREEEPHNEICKLITLPNRDQQNIEKYTKENVFTRKERKPQERFNRSLSDDLLLTICDEKSFTESKRQRNNELILSINEDNKNSKYDPFSIQHISSPNKHQKSMTDHLVTHFLTIDSRILNKNAISNAKNVEILETNKKSLNQIPKYFATSLDHLNSNSVLDQQLNYDFLKWEYGNAHCKIKQPDNIRIENENTLKKSLNRRPAKIAIRNQPHEQCSCDIRSIDSPISPESGFCEQHSEGSYKELIKNIDDKNINFVGNNVPRENAISDIDKSKENAKSHSYETISNINNSIRDEKYSNSNTSCNNILVNDM
ncbi:hypothetical protein PUN28_007569 [Cardiocondyla obscurior]